MPTQEASPTQSRLLLPPAELRNEVYLFVATNLPSGAPTLVPSLHHGNPSQAGSTSFATSMRTDYCTFWRQGLGLTQICRQIRREFLPIFTEHCPLKIDLEHVVQYVEDFIRLPGQTDNLAMANIRLTTRYKANCRADMRDIMLLKAISPTFNIEDEYPYMIDCQVLSIRKDAEWHNFLSQNASKLEWVMKENGRCGGCDFQMHDIDIILYVKPQHAEAWMCSTEMGEEHDAIFKEWKLEELVLIGEIDLVCVDGDEDERVRALGIKHVAENKEDGRMICDNCSLPYV